MFSQEGGVCVSSCVRVCVYVHLCCSEFDCAALHHRTKEANWTSIKFFSVFQTLLPGMVLFHPSTCWCTWSNVAGLSELIPPGMFLKFTLVQQSLLSCWIWLISEELSGGVLQWKRLPPSPTGGTSHRCYYFNYLLSRQSRQQPSSTGTFGLVTCSISCTAISLSH